MFHSEEHKQIGTISSATTSLSLLLFPHKLTYKEQSIGKPEHRVQNDSLNLSHTFCISSLAQRGMISPNPTYTSPKCWARDYRNPVRAMGPNLCM